jgi:hypothetical protein
MIPMVTRCGTEVGIQMWTNHYGIWQTHVGAAFADRAIVARFERLILDNSSTSIRH